MDTMWTQLIILGTADSKVYIYQMFSDFMQVQRIDFVKSL